jgi:hypothetical protein
MTTAAATPGAQGSTEAPKPDAAAAAAAAATPPPAAGAPPPADTAAAAAAAAAAPPPPAASVPEPGSTEAAAAAAAAAAKAPEKYELTIPEGGYVDESDLAALETVARAEGWTNEQAQARLTSYAALGKAQGDRFLADTTADPVYGGANLAETQRLARAALEKVRPAGTPRGDALRRILDKSGYGNHIEIVSLWADLGKLMAEDAPTSTGASGSGPTDHAAKLYGTG